MQVGLLTRKEWSPARGLCLRMTLIYTFCLCWTLRANRKRFNFNPLISNVLIDGSRFQRLLGPPIHCLVHIERRRMP